MEKNTSKFNEDFMKNYDENSNKGCIFEVDVEYPKRLHNLQSDLPFLPERMKIKKCCKLVCNLYEKHNHVVHIRTLKQALNHGLVLKKLQKVIQFNQKAWFNPKTAGGSIWRWGVNVEKRFDTSNYEVNRPLLTGKNKKVIGLMKDELGGKIMTEFVALRPKTYSYWMDDGNSDKKAKGTKKCVI